MASITIVHTDKWAYRDLLLEADEQVDMIEAYLDRGELFVLDDDGGAQAVCVVTDEGGGVFEIKNLATAPTARRRGYGRMMVDHVMAHYGDQGHTMVVGTGEAPATLGFYSACGFEYSHRIEGFFTDNYDHSIIDDGVLLTDMIMLKRPL